MRRTILGYQSRRLVTALIGPASLSILSVVCALVFPAPRLAEAIPVFARRYGVPCSTCHTAITRRNEFGDLFRRLGYHWPGGFSAPEKSGNDGHVEMRGNSWLEGLLPDKLPLGVAATLSAAYSSEPAAQQAFTLGTPSLNFLFGGAMGDHVSFFGTWATRGAPSELYLHFGRIFNRREINLRVGQFDPFTTLFKSNEALIGRFLLSSSSINGHTVSQGRLGAELNGVLFRRTFYAGGVVKNGGLGSNFDAYYHLSQKIGGINFWGEEPDINLDHPSLWEDFVITVGHWGYFGSVSTTEGKTTADIRRFGLDAQIRFRNAFLWGGAMLGLDKDRVVDTNNSSLTWFAEASYQITSWLIPAYMYQYRDSADVKRAFQQHDFGVIVLLLENLRARVKFSITDDQVNNETGEIQLMLGF